MAKEMFRAQRAEMLDSIEKRLLTTMEGRKYPEEIARTFNYILHDEFDRERKVEGGGSYSLKPTFVGQYFVDPENPTQTRVYSGHGTEACSPIPIERGVIGRAIRTGKDQYVPDVTKDEEHVACDNEMRGTEVVLLTWSEPYTSGRLEGCKVPLAVLDIDLNVVDAFLEADINRLRRIWLPYGKRIFPGEPSFTLPEDSKVYSSC